ncbi:MAG: DUF1857 family protein [Burkholderiaceae bacterium]|nr:DUF1857 family protein [Burkholderiaceae bacterium]
MAAMHFEHLVQINDPLMPLLEPLSREQLWRGLVRRAEEPTRFVLGLAGATIHDRRCADGYTELTRTLDFGSFQVQDRVVLTPMVSTVTHVAACARYPASRLTIRIEEPQPQMLFLRFIYEFDDGAAANDESELEAQTTALRKQAYRCADLDTVQCIRALAEAGELG